MDLLLNFVSREDTRSSAKKGRNLVSQPLAKIQKKALNKNFVGSRGGFSKEPLAAGGIFARASSINELF